jgi:hypothetical protein
LVAVGLYFRRACPIGNIYKSAKVAKGLGSGFCARVAGAAGLLAALDSFVDETGRCG